MVKTMVARQLDVTCCC